jgi:hypothetical protein
MFVGNTLSGAGDKFLGCEDFEISLITPMGHGRAVEDPAGILDIGDFLFRESISKDIFHQGLPALPAGSGYLVPGTHADTAVAPGQSSLDLHRANLNIASVTRSAKYNLPRSLRGTFSYTLKLAKIEAKKEVTGSGIILSNSSLGPPSL